MTPGPQKSLLELLADKHNDWVRMAKSLGANENSDDVVQEMYLKLYESVKDVTQIMYNDEINTFYVYKTLSSIIVDGHRKKSSEETSIESIKEPSIDDWCMIGDMDADVSDAVCEIVKQEMEGWHWYDNILCSIYFNDKVSMRELSKRTGISQTSIFITIKNGKRKIRQAVEKAGYKV